MSRRQLYTPPGNGAFPAVVVMHGCGGVAPNARAWAEWLRAEGYAALVVDSFTNRGLKRICGDATLKAFVALYPGCADLDGSLPGPGPVLMLLGGADNWALPGPCQHTAMRARAAGRVLQDVTYPDAHHAFDASNLRGRVHVPDARRRQGATVEYNPSAHADAEKQIREFLARYLR